MHVEQFCATSPCRVLHQTQRTPLRSPGLHQTGRQCLNCHVHSMCSRRFAGWHATEAPCILCSTCDRAACRRATTRAKAAAQQAVSQRAPSGGAAQEAAPEPPTFQAHRLELCRNSAAPAGFYVLLKTALVQLADAIVFCVCRPGAAAGHVCSPLRFGAARSASG